MTNFLADGQTGRQTDRHTQRPAFTPTARVWFPRGKMLSCELCYNYSQLFIVKHKKIIETHNQNLSLVSVI